MMWPTDKDILGQFYWQILKGSWQDCDLPFTGANHQEFIATDHLIYVALKTSGPSAFLSRYTEVGG